MSRDPQFSLEDILDACRKIRIAMRHVLAHGYFVVDPDIVWSVAATKIGALERDVSAYLESRRDQAGA